MVRTFVSSTKKVLAMVQVTRTMEPSWERFQRSLLLNYNINVIHFTHHPHYPWLQLAIFLLATIVQMQVFVFLIQKMNYLFFQTLLCLRSKKTKKIKISTTIVKECSHWSRHFDFMFAFQFFVQNVCIILFQGIFFFVLIMDYQYHCK